MKLLYDDLKKLKNISKKAALQAGIIIMKYKKSGFTITNKGVGSSIASQVVTEADFKSQEIILQLLIPYIDRYDLGLLTEESTDNLTRLSKDYFFAIDPMDGTKSFIDSDKGFSVSISLVSKSGIPVMAVIYDPTKDNLYEVISGSGIYKNGKSWKPVFRKPHNKLKVIVDPSFVKKIINGIEFIEYGGAVMNAILLLEGMADCYLKLPKKSEGGGSIWDFSGTSLLFTECGALALDIYGNPLELNNPETTFMNRFGVIFSSGREVRNSLRDIMNFSGSDKIEKSQLS